MSSHSYDAIDKGDEKDLQSTSYQKQLHDEFKSTHNGQIPDKCTIKESNGHSEDFTTVRTSSVATVLSATKRKNDGFSVGYFCKVYQR